MRYGVKKIILIVLTFLCIVALTSSAKMSDEEEKKQAQEILQNIYSERGKAIIDRDGDIIKNAYNTKTRNGQWAYEYELRRMKYLHQWEEKQGIHFTHINPIIKVKRIRGGDGKYSINFLCCAEYKYEYDDNSEMVNVFRIGTYHIMNLENREGNWIITKEWYKDPFGDVLDLGKLKTEDLKAYISAQKCKDEEDISERRVSAMEYAQMYCGAASQEKYGFKYNNKYRDFNSLGGDCANFASQILHEGGKFKETSAWRYSGGEASRAWVNADGFTHYMLNSNRASIIAYGNYEKVYKASYNLLPGDFVAYEEKGDITHISVVSGSDSKGYALVTCHNTDRDMVPWDLGWGGKKVKFYLVRVHY